jgi:selenoprotein W-related protein
VAEELLTEHPDRISELVIVPFTDGRFVVKAGDRSLFSKADTGRFPAQGEVAGQFAEVR